MEVSVIIPTMKGREPLLKKLLSTIYDEHEIIIVDDENLLLAAKRNKGARLATGEYLFFIDDDNYLAPGAIQKMLRDFDESIGVMGMTACYDDWKRLVADGGSLRNYITGFTTGLRTNESIFNSSLYHSRWNKASLYQVDEVANAFIIPREVFNEVGGFDEVNFPMDMNESDICQRIKDMGYRIVMNPKAICYHKSVTYSCYPTFRREMYAYFHGRGRIGFARKHYPGLCYWLHLSIFLPLFFCFYTGSLLWRRNFRVILPFWKGIADGLSGRLKNKYQ